MRPLFRRYILLLLVVFLLVSAGCITSRPSSQSTAASGNATPVATPRAGDATATVSPAPTFSDHGSLNVLRGEPFTLTGTVPDRTMTEVQVWLLNGSVSTSLVPALQDGSFSVTLDAGVTSALSRNFSSAIIAQFPSPPNHFAVTLDPATGQITGSSVIPSRILTEVNDKQYYPTTQEDFLAQAIDSPGTNNSCIITFLNGVDATLDIDPISQGPPGIMTVSGNTSLPAGTSLSIDVSTVNTHPTPKNYDFSHEIASGSAAVTAGTEGINRYSGTVNTSLLNSGRYMVYISPENQALQADAMGYADVIAPISTQAGPGNYINWSALALPTLATNETMAPVLLVGEWTIVPPGASAQNNEVPYGSIIDCAPDGVCRVYDENGVQYLAVYDSNEAHMMGVPNGAMIDSAAGGNVTIISLNGSVILTKIDEYPARS
ncbi:hypothetical protein [Methanoregula sp.]|uniref:hypothetical protein n=1 Tax=Methanoregula sp. TaxID=2052170 RepID=UPI002BFD3593|nr:hypothetical protein [Methanoregula sp.]HVP96485.1 hypothetical protein [Methanoregula sp.]